MGTDIFPTTAGKHCSYTSQHYRIAGNFQGRKLLRVSRFCVYSRKFSLGVWCPLVWQKRAIHKSFLHENHIFTNLRKFLLHVMYQVFHKFNLVTSSGRLHSSGTQPVYIVHQTLPEAGPVYKTKYTHVTHTHVTHTRHIHTSHTHTSHTHVTYTCHTHTSHTHTSHTHVTHTRHTHTSHTRHIHTSHTHTHTRHTHTHYTG